MKKKIVRIMMVFVILIGVISAQASLDVQAASYQKNSIIGGKKITSFKTYYNKVLKKQYGTFKRKQTGTMHNWNDKWMQIGGVMGVAVQDFDSDGKKEMMVCVAEKLNDGENSKIILQMYEKEKSGIKLTSELRFNPYYDRTEVDFASDITLSAAQSVEASFIVNFIKRGKKRFIVCEEHQCQQTFADGSGRDYWLIEYKNNRFSYISSFTQTGGGSSDFVYTVFTVKNGKTKTKQVYYSEDTNQKGKYRTYDTAIKKYFEKYNIKLNRNARFNVEVSGKSILLADKRNAQLFSFYNKRIKDDWKKGVYKFCATVKGLDNLK